MTARRLLPALGAILALSATALIATPGPASAATRRLSGSDRAATAAAIARAGFERGVPVAFVATGATYPDALAAGPAAAASGGPVLLAERDRLPAPTRTVLEELDPRQIVVIGGAASISDAVSRELEGLAGEGGVTRHAGRDRYETASLLSQRYFAATDTVYLASGAGFADALAGAPAAFGDDAPLLLTTPNGLAPWAEQELRRLTPGRAVILGGTGSISQGVETKIRSMVPTVERLAGADRFATSAAVGRSRFQPGIPAVFLATGRAFADALAGGPHAGLVGGPVLLTEPNCIPKVVNDLITELRPTEIVLLGGTSALGAGVESRSVCATAGAGLSPTVQPASAPAWNDDGPDPHVVRFGETWYAYTTGTTWGNNIGVLVSDRPDGGWRTVTGRTYGSTALANIPSWQARDSQWAPGVFQFGGRYVMFYAARIQNRPAPRVCLSVATADTPRGPFTDRTTGPIICQPDGSIDPHPFVDPQGNPWLYWKNNDEFADTVSKVWAVRLAADGVTPTGPHHQVLAKNTERYPWQTTVDNPQMVVHQGRYYLFHTGGDYVGNDTYAVGYAVCSGPTGPCTTAQNPILRSYPGADGPGGGTVAAGPDGRWWMSYHAWPSGSCHSYECGAERRLFVAPLSWR